MADNKSEIRNPCPPLQAGRCRQAKSETIDTRFTIHDSRFTLFSDGGSRGNPGPAACGVVIFNGDKEIKRLSKTIGSTTNNQAEYQALEMGLAWILSNCLFERGEKLCIEGKLDSELVVKQLNGEYKMKNAELKPWFAQIRNLVIELGGSVTFTHIPREQNKIADMMVNEALDREQGAESNRWDSESIHLSS